MFPDLSIRPLRWSPRPLAARGRYRFRRRLGIPGYPMTPDWNVPNGLKESVNGESVV